jgi:hypothetical protein
VTSRPARRFERPQEKGFETQDGTFEILDLAPAAMWFEADAEGFVAYRTNAMALAEGRVEDLGDLRLWRANTLHGLVVEAEIGHPIEGAKIQVFDYGQETVWSRADGRFALDGVDKAAHRLTVEHPDFVGSIAGPFPEGDARIELERGGGVDGFLFDERGVPLPEIPVWVGSIQHGGERSGTTNSQGYFRILALSPGRKRVSAAPESRPAPRDKFFPRETTAVVERGRITRVVFPSGEPRAGCALTGRLTREGEPVARTQVRVTPHSQPNRSIGDLTSEDGTFRLEDVPAGPATLAVEVRGRAFPRVTSVGRSGSSMSLDGGGPAETRSSWVVVVPEVPEHRVDLALPSGGIEGRVVQAVDGSPAPNSLVNVWREDEGEPRLAGVSPTDEQGMYRILDLAPGEYRVVATVIAEWRSQRHDLRRISRESVRVHDSLTRVDLEMPRPARVSVLLEDPDGRPAPGAHVFLLPAGPRLRWLPDPALPDAWGGIRGEGGLRDQVVSPDTYVAIAVHGDFLPVVSAETFVPADSQTEIRLRLRRGGTRVRVRMFDDAGGILLARVKVCDAQGWEFPLLGFGVESPDPAETFCLYGHLPPGHYTVIVDGDRAFRDKSVPIVVGGASPQDVVVRLDPEDSLR